MQRFLAANNKAMFLLPFMLILVICLLGNCEKRRRPSCTITQPGDYENFGKGEIVDVLVDAKDPNGNDLVIHFFLNGSGVYSTSTFPYCFTWETNGYEAGLYEIKVRAIDNEGRSDWDETRVNISISKPRISTKDVFEVHLTSAKIGGSIITDGGATITETGVYWGTESNPELAGEKFSMNAVEGEYSAALTGLVTNTPYFYKAYAVNSQGESLGEEKGFTTLGNEVGTFTDSRDGIEYNWVRIGNQTWMAENLAYLPDVYPPDDESIILKRYYVYDYFGNDAAEARNSEYYMTYGALYNWKASLNVCPAGWHLPTDEEWKVLERNLGMSETAADNAGWRGSFEGRLMKARTGWNNQGNGSNISDFSAIPGGYRLTDNTFRYDGIYSNWWTANEFSSSDGLCRYLYFNNTGVYRGSFGKEFGFSVRCVQD